MYDDGERVTVQKKDLWTAIVLAFQDGVYSKDVKFKDAIDRLFEYIKEED